MMKKVTIICLVYNHEPYIRQCLDGFVMQKTDFAFEAFVHDDASTDGTADIIQKYAQRYPDIIKPVIETENQYSKDKGFVAGFINSHANSPYLAFCDGDDYWTNPDKLQMQVDYMESHPECGLCYTKARIWIENAGRFNEVRGQEYRGIDSLIQHNYIPTMSILYRKEVREGFMAFAKDFNGRVFDWMLFLYIASEWDLHMIPEVTSVYRMHEGSMMNHYNYEGKVGKLTSVYNQQRYVIQKLGRDHLLPAVENGYYSHLFDVAFFNKNYAAVMEYKKKVKHFTAKQWVKCLIAYVKTL